MAARSSSSFGPRLLGVLNVTADSFSDGGRYLQPAAAISHAQALLDAGADFIDLGGIASNPESRPVTVAEEIDRLEPVVAALQAAGAAVSVDTFRVETQRWALARRVAMLNDIHGFATETLYPELAASNCYLVLMHSIHGVGQVSRASVPVDDVAKTLDAFFERRLRAFDRAGIARSRVILDPGMGFFLGADPATSLRALAQIPRLKAAFGLPVLISVTRKSFLRTLIGRPTPAEAGAATLAAELYAAARGVDYIRTHDVAALRDGLLVWTALGAREQ